jgi:hypothetical protein
MVARGIAVARRVNADQVGVVAVGLLLLGAVLEPQEFVDVEGGRSTCVGQARPERVMPRHVGLALRLTRAAAGHAWSVADRHVPLTFNVPKVCEKEAILKSITMVQWSWFKSFGRLRFNCLVRKTQIFIIF